MNSVTRMPQQQIIDPAQWFWDGTQWVCGCPPTNGTCPPPVVQVPGFPPPFFPPPITQPPWYPGANGGVAFGVTAPPNPIRGSFWWDGKVLWMFDGAAWVNTATGGTQGGAGGGGSGSGAGTVIISTQPPGNPVAGMQWWDGTVLRVWDGTQWQVVGPGASAGPVPTTTHTFRITQPTTVSMPVNTWAIAPFTVNPQIDPLLSWDSTTKKITPTKGGVYLWFIREFLGTGSPPGQAAIALARNDPGSFIPQMELTALALIGSGAPGGFWLSAGGVSIMNGTTDYMRYWIVTSDPNGMYGQTFANIDAYLLP